MDAGRLPYHTILLANPPRCCSLIACACSSCRRSRPAWLAGANSTSRMSASSCGSSSEARNSATSSISFRAQQQAEFTSVCGPDDGLLALGADDGRDVVPDQFPPHLANGVGRHVHRG